MIIRELKHGTFIFDEEHRLFSASAEKWNKVYLFAYMRFILSVTQKNVANRKVVKK